MLVSARKGASIILAHERRINDYLMELAVGTSTTGYDPRPPLIDILQEIADLRFTEGVNIYRPAGCYHGTLYFDVFGLDPVGNVTERLHQLKRPHRRCDPHKLAEALRTFHCDYAFAWENHRLHYPFIDDLLDKFVVTMQ